MQQTPFRDWHVSHNAQFVDFAGWEMPIRYGSILEEHKQCRTKGAIFDVSHMGRLHLTGRGARKLIERVVTRKITDMKVGQCRYAMVCNNAGGVMDDVIVYRFEDKWMIVCNASNRAKVVAHIQQVIKAESHACVMEDVTLDTAMLAFQGPQVMEQIAKLSKTIPELKNYWFTEKNYMVVKLIVSRTGYTGEDGVEVILGSKAAGMALKLLLSQAAEGTLKPSGLGARDSLRIEAGMPLYGHELDEQTDPLSAGLKFGVSLDKHLASDADVEIPRFIGQDALESIAKNGLPKMLIGIKMESRRTPRQGQPLSVGGVALGSVTSGCMSPTLGYPIAMAFVKPGVVQIGDKVDVDFNGAKETGTVTPLPFYKRLK